MPQCMAERAEVLYKDKEMNNTGIIHMNNTGIIYMNNTGIRGSQGKG